MFLNPAIRPTPPACMRKWNMISLKSCEWGFGDLPAGDSAGRFLPPDARERPDERRDAATVNLYSDASADTRGKRK